MVCPCRPDGDEEGFTLLAVAGIFLVILLFLGVLSDSAGEQVVVEGRSANAAAASAEARAGLDLVVSDLQTGVSTSNVEPNVWETITPAGQVAACPGTGSTPCFELASNVTAGSQTGNDPAEAVYQVVGETGCGKSPTLCAKVGYQAELVHNDYVGYLMFDNYETLAPSLYPNGYPSGQGCTSDEQSGGPLFSSGCLYPAYYGNTSQNVFDGAIRTNASFLVFCGDPTVQSATVNRYPGDTATSFPQAPGCSAPPGTVYPSQSASDLPFPTPTDLTTLEQIAGTVTGSGGDTTIVASPSGLSVDGTAEAYPQSGVVYVDGTATVSGVVSGGLTVVASQDVVVSSNLTYGCPSGDTAVSSDVWTSAGLPSSVDTACTSPSGVTTQNLTGLIAGGNVELDWQDGADLQVDAAMLADSGTVFTPGFDTDADTDSSPITASGSGSGPAYLGVFGAIAENYRGGFGAYDETSGTADFGSIVYGYGEDFVYDSRLLTSQPPWFITPKASPWQVTSLVGLPPAKATLVADGPVG